MLIWVLIIIGANVGGVASALLARSRRDARAMLTRLGRIYLVLLALSCALSVYSALHVFRARVPIGMDPAAAERILSEAYWEASSCAVTGLLAFLLPALLAIVWARRAREQELRAEDEPRAE